LGNNLQHALEEVNSLQIISKLLVKELEETTAKFEVMVGETLKLMSEESQNILFLARPERHENAGKNSEPKDNYTPVFPIATNNIFISFSFHLH
jgi:hypothetical protein